MKSVMKLLLLILGASAFAAPCGDYLKKDARFRPIGVTRIETLKGRAITINDVSQDVKERKLPTDKLINIFRMDDIFAEGKYFLGFGRPNVYMAFPPTEERPSWEKFDAKSLKRADSKIVDTRGFAQSGILLVFKDLSPDQVEAIYANARDHEGSRNWTCVNSNCKVMKDAGFSIPGLDMAEIYFPTHLLKALLYRGLELNGEKVEFDVVRVNPDFLETIGAGIDKAVALTPCRHWARSCQDDSKSAMAKNTFMVFAKKAGSRMLGFFLTSDKDGKPVIKEKEVRFFPDPDTADPTYGIRVSEPSRFGSLLRVLWGPHAKFKVDVSALNLAERFGTRRLNAYPSTPQKTKDRLVQDLKKNVLFNRAVVGLINSQMERRERTFSDITMSQLYDMLRVHTAESKNKYTLVMTSRDLIITKIDIQNSRVDWVLTKHLVASNYSDDVIFAGEFYKAEDGAIHIDDNSGTYQPPKGLLEDVADFFRELFPGVNIIADARG